MAHIFSSKRRIRNCWLLRKWIFFIVLKILKKFTSNYRLVVGHFSSSILLIITFRVRNLLIVNKTNCFWINLRTIRIKSTNQIKVLENIYGFFNNILFQTILLSIQVNFSFICINIWYLLYSVRSQRVKL